MAWYNWLLIMLLVFVVFDDDNEKVGRNETSYTSSQVVEVTPETVIIEKPKERKDGGELVAESLEDTIWTVFSIVVAIWIMFFILNIFKQLVNRY